MTKHDLLTKKDLTQYYIDREKLYEAEKMLGQLRTYADTHDRCILQEIKDLEESILDQDAALREKAGNVFSTLSSIDDITCRDALQMHYCQGMYWKEIAVSFGTTAPLLRARCQRALDCSPIPPGEKPVLKRRDPLMTRKELAQYYNDRRKLREMQETLSGLHEYAAASGEDFSKDISILEELIRERVETLRDREAEILIMLDDVDDVCRRTELKMHYLRGMSWEEIATALGTTLPAMTNRRNRSLEQAGIGRMK